MANGNESFPSLNTISSENRTLLEETFGSYNPEGQPTLPSISLEDGELVVPTIQIQSDLLPDDQEIFFSDEPIDLPTIFTTSQGEVGLGVILPLESFQFPKGSPWDNTLMAYVTGSFLVKFEQSMEQNDYNRCRLISPSNYSLVREMILNKRSKVFETEFSEQYDLDILEDATSFRFRKIYVSNKINRVEGSSDLAACVLMYLE